MVTSEIIGPIIPSIPGNRLEGQFSLVAMSLAESILLFSSR